MHIDFYSNILITKTKKNKIDIQVIQAEYKNKFDFRRIKILKFFKQKKTQFFF